MAKDLPADLLPATTPSDELTVREVTHLTAALASQTIISTAVGILMERFDLSDDQALAFLIRHSLARNLDLAVISGEFVDTANASSRTEHGHPYPDPASIGSRRRVSAQPRRSTND